MQNSHIFSQILQKIDWNHFSKVVDKYQGDARSKGLTTKSIFTTMIFAQISGADSLREICQGMAMQGGNLAHMGILNLPKVSSLSYANSKRPWQIFRDMFEYMVELYQGSLNLKSKPGNYKGKLFSLDSTVIDLCLSIFDWAKFRVTKGAIKVHTLLDHDGLIPVFADITNGKAHDINPLRELVRNTSKLPANSVVAMDRAYVDYELYGEMTDKKYWFVTRLKSNALYEVIEEREAPKGRNIKSDEVIKLTSAAGLKCTCLLRRVVVWDETNQKDITLLSNHLNFGASTISGIYKKRWEVELFFKQIKQNLKIKSFVGTSENAVKIQIYSALCSILLTKYLKSISDSKRLVCKEKSFSFSNMMMMLRISLFRYSNLDDWLANPFIAPPRSQISSTQEVLVLDSIKT